MPTISIIVPVYNAQNTLKECIDSIIHQSFRDFELILVDDGSTDKSAEICDNKAILDNRIIVVHGTNSGVGAARNKGLEIASGKWITFVDSDDCLDKDFLKWGIRNKDEDLIIGTIDYINNKSETTRTEDSLPHGVYNNESDIKDLIKNYLVSNIMRPPWGKLYKHELIAELRFPENMPIGEDTCFVITYLQRCHSIYVNGLSCYKFRMEDNSSVKKYKTSITNATTFLANVFDCYFNLKIKSPEFEFIIFNYFKNLCQEEIRITPAKWYHNKKVIKVFCHIHRTFNSFQPHYREKYIIRYFGAFFNIAYHE